MNPYYELAYALASESLCLFVGTGFSKHITNNQAPDWKSLLIDCCSALNNPNQLTNDLFPNGTAVMPLEECASIINLQMQKEEKDIYVEIAKRIGKIKADTKSIKPIKDFVSKHPSLKFITTNYDLLIEENILDNIYTGFCPGFPINRQRKHTEVYHIHGAIKHAKKMIVTAHDYYNFINNPDYFSKRLDTLLEENTTVIIGYSLGDINLKSILNSHRKLSSHQVNRQHLFFLSRKSIPQHIKDYYDDTYGLRVIEQTTIDDFIKKLDTKYDLIVNDVEPSKDQLKSVIEKKYIYTDEYIKTTESFKKIIATISSTGFNIYHPNTLSFLESTLKRKIDFTKESGAWGQYDQLSEWLIQLGCIMNLEGTDLEKIYLEALKISFNSMSKDKVLGKSWQSYTIWKNDWFSITFKNRILIKNFTKTEKMNGDFDDFIDK